MLMHLEYVSDRLPAAFLETDRWQLRCCEPCTHGMSICETVAATSIQPIDILRVRFNGELLGGAMTSIPVQTKFSSSEDFLPKALSVNYYLIVNT